MNTQTGNFESLDNLRTRYDDDMARAAEDGWVAVPDGLTRQARRLMERNKAVNLKGNSQLAKFAQKKRKEQKAARRRNRGR